MEAPAATRVILDKGQHFAEVRLFADGVETATVKGPPRRCRPEALKDCLELRKVAVKCHRDPALFLLRQRVKELKDQTWTVKDLGGRLLEGAEGPPPGFAMPRGATVCEQVPSETRAPAGKGAAAGGRSRLAKGQAPSPECIVEVADVWEATMLGSGAVGGDWEAKAEVLLRRTFSRFGPVMDVRISAADGSGADPVASVRFASAKAAEAVMVKSKRGLVPLHGDRCVRVRQPAATEAVWRKFPEPAQTTAGQGDSLPSKKRMRPNERFASRTDDGNPVDESEAFWEAQKERRGAPVEPPSVPPPPEEEPSAEQPEKPQPAATEPGASEEDLAACEGERQVAAAMDALLEAPFSQRRKLLKKLRMQWHPDKSPEERKVVATRVFQFIQAHDAWLTFHEIS